MTQHELSLEIACDDIVNNDFKIIKVNFTTVKTLSLITNELKTFSIFGTSSKCYNKTSLSNVSRGGKTYYTKSTHGGYRHGKRNTTII